MKKIVVVGGGTAGWITALFCKKVLKCERVTLVESSEIGILGAGEGTTPHFLDMLSLLDIDIRTLFKEAGATFKNGIKFTNWNGDGESYLHPFFEPGTLLNSKYHVGRLISEQKNLDPLIISYFLSEKNKPKVIVSEDNKFSIPGTIGLHFDARKLAEVLKNIGTSRGINRVDAKVSSLNFDGENIKEIVCETGLVLECDFVFDCTGFKRMIIGGEYRSEWISYKDNLPNNKALPFLIENKTDVIPPYTEAIAMKYGWVWKIPVQGRYGCGYVFDSRKITDEQAKNEVRELFGDVIFPTVFNFEPGCYKETWKGNCIALGLASGFIEPLEATSIWVTILSLQELEQSISGTKGNQAAKNSFNNFVFNVNEQIKSFIYFHYVTKRNDTDYWSKFETDNQAPYFYKKIKEQQNYLNLFRLGKTSIDTFGSESLLTVGAGGKFFTKEAGESLLDTVSNNDKTVARSNYVKGCDIVRQALSDCVEHYKIIKILGGT
jgi:tryptophan halogenase